MKLALLSVGVAILVLIELALRLAGVAASGDAFQGFAGAPIFVPATLSDGRPGFEVDPALSPEPFNRVSFAAEKPPGAARVFVLGGSAAYGYPRDQHSAFSRWLEDRLALELPGREVEVLNLGAMSYGSGRLLEVARRCLEHDADLVLVAAGNNEYVERRVAADVKEITWLRRGLDHLRLYRVVRRAVQRIAPPARQAASLTERAQVTRDVMPRTTELDLEVLDAFESNLRAIVAAAREAGAAAMISNVPTNMRDWSPQASAPARPLAGAERAAWLERRQEGDRRMALGDASGALAAYLEAVAIDAGSAELHFATGRAALAASDLSTAREHLEAARDLDLRPIRATGAILARAARAAATERAPFVNVDAVFRSVAEQGIPGNDLLFDYCHPTVDGHRLWAAAIAEGLREAELLAPAGEWVEATAAVVAAEQTAVEALVDDRAIATQELFARGFAAATGGDRELAIELYSQAIALDPGNHDAYYNRARQHLALGHIVEGIADCERAVALRPDHYQALGNLGMARFDLGDLPGAREALERALAIQPTYVLGLVNLGKTFDALGEPGHARESFDRALAVDPRDVRARIARAVFRLNTGDAPGGLDDLDRAEELSPGNPDIQRIRKQVQGIR